MISFTQSPSPPSKHNLQRRHNMKYWLMKTEPTDYNIDDLQHDTIESWHGVRNYQARNMMRDEMKKGDLVFFYHSNCKIPGIAGIAEIHKTAHPDSTQFDEESPYFDPKSTRHNPRWVLVDVKFIRKFNTIISLTELKQHPQLDAMIILRKGNRLSITPVTTAQWHFIETLSLS